VSAPARVRGLARRVGALAALVGTAVDHDGGGIGRAGGWRLRLGARGAARPGRTARRRGRRRMVGVRPRRESSRSLTVRFGIRSLRSAMFCGTGRAIGRRREPNTVARRHGAVAWDAGMHEHESASCNAAGEQQRRSAGQYRGTRLSPARRATGSPAWTRRHGGRGQPSKELIVLLGRDDGAPQAGANLVGSRHAYQMS
jgi:hypothetical protein